MKVVKEHYEDYDGFVIAHGTDTMALHRGGAFLYDSEFGKADRHHRSTAADQFGYHGCKDKPVRQLYYACDDASQGVQIVFDGKVIAGTRAKKVRTKSYNAFSSIDFPYLAVIQDRRILRYLPMLPL